MTHQTSQPAFEGKNSKEGNQPNVLTVPQALPCRRKHKRADDSERRQAARRGGVEGTLPGVGNFKRRSPHHESFSFSAEDLIRDDAGQGATHQRPSLPGTNQLISRNREDKFKQIAVEVRISFLVGWCEGQRITGELSSETIEGFQVLLKGRQGPEEARPSPKASKSVSIASHESRVDPSRRPLIRQNSRQKIGKEAADPLRKQI